MVNLRLAVPKISLMIISKNKHNGTKKKKRREPERFSTPDALPQTEPRSEAV
jgi:hypothetical protein